MSAGLVTTVRDTVTVDGRRIRYSHSSPSGAADAGTRPAPVLLLHGIGRSLDDWSDAQELLAERHDVVSIDLPGFGLSDPLTRTTLAGLAVATLCTLDALVERGVLADRPVVLMGNSLGGAVALEASAMRRARVEALVLVDPAGFGREVTAALRVLALPVVGPRLLNAEPETLRRTERAIVFDERHVTAARLERAALYAKQPHAGRVLLETAKELGTGFGVRAAWRKDLLARAGRLDLPTLVMWGRDDRILPASHLEAARKALPRATFHLWDETGHMPQLERPVEFATLVEGFLSTSTTTTTAEEDAR